MPQVKVHNLTAAQSVALGSIVKSKTDGFVIETVTTQAVLNGTAVQALAVLQDVMNELREIEGDSRRYQSLVSVRNKLDEAVRDGGQSKVVRLINGAQVNGETPSTLNGVAVERTTRGRGRGNATPATPAPAITPAEVPTPARADILEKMRPLSPQPQLTAGMADNFHHLARNAPTGTAREFWERKAHEAEAAAEVLTVET